MSSVKILDNGTDISKSVDWKSIDAISVLTKETGTFKFNVRQGVGQTSPAKTIPAIGDTIELYDSTGIIWGGTCTEVEPIISGLMITWQVTATDWGYLLDGTLVKKNYAGMDPHDIVVDLINTFCSGKGFTTTGVNYGNFLVETIKFNYQQPSKALQSLAKLIGWDWFVDPNKNVHFFLGDVDDGEGGGAIGDGGKAPIKVDATSGDIEWNSLDIDLQITNMQNSVYVIGGTLPVMFTALTFDGGCALQRRRPLHPVHGGSSELRASSQDLRDRAGGSTPTVTAPVSHPRIDVLTIDTSGTLAWTTGTEASSPSVPAYPSGKIPICELYNVVSETALYDNENQQSGEGYPDAHCGMYSSRPSCSILGCSLP